MGRQRCKCAAGTGVRLEAPVGALPRARRHGLRAGRRRWSAVASRLAIAAVLATGCGGGGDGRGSEAGVRNLCGFDTGSAQVAARGDAACTGCAIENAGAAADSDPGTAAIVRVNNSASAGGQAIRVTSGSGATFAAGSEAGFFWSGADGNWCSRIRLVRDGVVVQDQPIVFCNASAGSGATSMTANQSFDGVEVVLTSGQSIGSARIAIAEVCSAIQPD